MHKTDIEVMERRYKKFDVSLAHRNREKPHGISGMTRLKNDMDFVEESITSHLQWLDELVIILQPSDDDTEALAYSLEDKYEKVRVAFYPFDVAWIARPITPRTIAPFRDTPAHSVYSVTHMTNWGLSQCDYSWIAPIEGDCISLPTFAQIRDLIDLQPDTPRYFGRTCLNLAGRDQDQFSYTAPHNAGWDVPVMPNNASWHSIKAEKWESYNMTDHVGGMTPMGWQFIHMQRCKKKYDGGYTVAPEKWEPFTTENLNAAIAEYNVPFVGPRDDSVLDDWFGERHAE